MTDAPVTNPPRSRKRRIDRRDIVMAACELLDDEGAEALSMARLGDRLGVTAMALYRHVSDRRDLENAVVEHVMADLDIAASMADDWRDGVRGWMQQVRAHWLRHRWLGRLLGTHYELTPSWIAILDQLAVTLDAAGLDTDALTRELVHVSRTTAGIVLLEIAAPLPHGAAYHDAERAQLGVAGLERWRSIADELDTYTNDVFFDDVVAATITRIELARGSS